MASNVISHLIFSTFFAVLILATILQHCPTNGFPQSKNSKGKNSRPKKICREEFRAFLNATGRCYGIGLRGPCGRMMVVEKLPGSDIGRCACENSGCAPRPKVYWPEKNRCYFIFSQGPCPSGQWLLPRKKGVPICKAIPCPDEYNSQPKPFDANSKFLFSYKGKCYTSATRDKGPCPTGESAYFLGFQHECLESYGCPYNVGGSYPLNSCNGTQPDRFGGCEPQAYFSPRQAS